MHFHVPLSASHATASDSGNEVVTFPSLYLTKNYKFKNILIKCRKNFFNPVHYIILFSLVILSVILVRCDYIIFILSKILAWISKNFNFEIEYCITWTNVRTRSISKKGRVEKFESLFSHLRLILSYKILDICHFDDVIFGQLVDCTNKKSSRAESFCQRAKRSHRVLYQQCNVSE